MFLFLKKKKREKKKAVLVQVASLPVLSSHFYARRPLSETSFSESILLPTFQFPAKRGSEQVTVSLPLPPFIHFKGRCLGDEDIAQFAVQQRRCHMQGKENLPGPTTWAEVHLAWERVDRGKG